MTIPDKWTMADINQLVDRGEVSDLSLIPIVVTNGGTPDARWSESICLALTEHGDPAVRANAVLGLGHHARVAGTLDRERAVPAIYRALVDPHESVRAHASSAAEDTKQFLGWTDFGAIVGYQDSDFEIAKAAGSRVQHFQCFLGDDDRPEKLIVCLDGLGWHHSYLDAFLGFWSALDENDIHDLREDYEGQPTVDIAELCAIRGRPVRRLACARTEVGTQIEYRFDNGSLYLAELDPTDPDSCSVLRWGPAGQHGVASDLALSAVVRKGGIVAF